jgi:CRISPR-associated protein Cmr4
METKVFLIKPFTNMHVGSGKTNAGIVDNTIQRDVLTTLPVINSTSLKGALREYADNHFSKEHVTFAFGSGNEKKDGIEQDNKANKAGKYIFFIASLLSIPARSNNIPFLNATTRSIIKNFIHQIELLRMDECPIIDNNTFEAFKALSEIEFQEGEKAICFEKKLSNAVVEFYNIKTVEKEIAPDKLAILKRWIGENPVIVHESIFDKEIVGKLPIIARNYLENGQSANLWYEEILPRESVFYTFIAKSKDKDNWDIDFDGIKVQIGANASVGYGYSTIYQPK